MKTKPGQRSKLRRKRKNIVKRMLENAINVKSTECKKIKTGKVRTKYR